MASPLMALAGGQGGLKIAPSSKTGAVSNDVGAGQFYTEAPMSTGGGIPVPVYIGAALVGVYLILKR